MSWVLVLCKGQPFLAEIKRFDLLKVVGKNKMYSPKWWFHGDESHARKQKNTFNKHIAHPSKVGYYLFSKQPRWPPPVQYFRVHLSFWASAWSPKWTSGDLGEQKSQGEHSTWRIRPYSLHRAMATLRSPANFVKLLVGYISQIPLNSQERSGNKAII